MEATVLTALKRDTKHKRSKEAGYISGVIYGDGVNGSVPVKFEEQNLLKVIAKHGSHSKVSLLFEDSNKSGFIKELQRNPLSHKVIHIDVQVVSGTHEVKTMLPIVFKGKEHLFTKQLRLQIHKTEIEVQGRIDIMPDIAEADVSSKELGDNITAADFIFSPGIKIVDKGTELYGNIVHLHAAIEEPEPAAETAEAVPAAESTGEPGKTEKA